MTKFVYDMMYYLSIARSYDYREVVKLLDLESKQSISGFTEASSDLFKGEDKYGYELIMIPRMGTYRVGQLILLYRGECVMYTNYLEYANPASKICKEFVEVNHGSPELHLYDLEAESSSKWKGCPIDIESYDSDLHFQKLILMDLPDYDVTKELIWIYKDMLPFCKYFGMNCVISTDYYNMDLSELEIPNYVVDSFEYLRGDYVSGREHNYQIITDPSMKDVYNKIIGGTQ